MFALDLCARFTRLLDDKVRGVLFDHRFDVGLLVARNQYEALDVGCDPIVLGRSKFDLLETTFIAALTVERQRLVDAVLFGAFLNPLIDGAKQLLVMCGSIREGHKPILPQYALSGEKAFYPAFLQEVRRRSGTLADSRFMQAALDT
jgi:hypothetical protein